MDKNDFPDLLYIAQRISMLSDKLDKISDHMCTIADSMDSEEDILICATSMLSGLCVDAKIYVQNLHDSIPNMSVKEWNIMQEKFDKIVEEAKKNDS